MLKDAERFIKVYDSLPLEERKNTIMVIDDEPVSWSLAHEEIRNNTKRGKTILKNLIELELI